MKLGGYFSSDYAPFWLATIIGCSITGLVVFFASINTNRLALQVFQSTADNISQEIEAKFQSSIRAIYHLGAFYDGSNEVTRDEFDFYVSGFIKHYPEIHALEWVPRITHAQRGDYEKQQSRFKHAFKIVQKHPQKGMVPAHRRELYFPVTFIHPLRGNESAFGFDLASNPDRKDMIQKAIFTNDLTASSGIKLVQEKRDSYSILVALPITRKGMVSQTVNDVNLKGIVLGVYRIKAIVETISQLVGLKSYKIDIFDLTEEHDPFRLYHNESNLDDDFFQYTGNIKVANRLWRLDISADPELFGAYSLIHYFAIIVIGLGFTLLIMAYIRLINKSDEQSFRISEQLAHAVSMRREYERKLIESNSKLEALSLEDTLMKIANRRAFDDYLMDEWKRAQRSGKTLSLIIADIDNFKKFNDKYGHVIGDQCLCKVADAFKEVVKRPSDLIARYGGEELAVILPETDEVGAEQVAENIRQAVINQCIPHADSDVRSIVTISIGVTTIYEAEKYSVAEIIKQADAALYQAKDNGKNRVERSIPSNYLQADNEKTESSKPHGQNSG